MWSLLTMKQTHTRTLSTRAATSSRKVALGNTKKSQERKFLIRKRTMKASNVTNSRKAETVLAKRRLRLLNLRHHIGLFKLSQIRNRTKNSKLSNKKIRKRRVRFSKATSTITNRSKKSITLSLNSNTRWSNLSTKTIRKEEVAIINMNSIPLLTLEMKRLRLRRPKLSKRRLMLSLMMTTVN